MKLSKLGIKYTGLPLHLTSYGQPIPWRVLFHRPSLEGWSFSPEFESLYYRELPMWRKLYVPPFSLVGKTVLNVGAGCGETAKFYLEELGAKQVIAVEMEPIALKYLNENAKTHPITVIDKPFSVDMLSIYHYFMEMDIEGYEACLLEGDTLKNYHVPCVIEAHTGYLIDKFIYNGFVGNNLFEKQRVVNVSIMHRW
jgi:hypothetical protein